MTLSLRPVPADRWEEWRAGAIDRLAGHRFASGSHDLSAARTAAEAVVRRLLPGDPPNPNARVWQVTDGIAARGSVWLDLEDGGGPTVLDVALDRLDTAGEVRSLVENALRAEKQHALRVAVFRSAPSLVAFADDPGFSPAATQMALSLARPIAASPVDLRPMTEEFFASYLEGDIESYAQERMLAGLGTLEEMRRVARRSFHSLLPQGVSTPGQQVWTAHAGGEQVGMLWINTEFPRSYVYNIVVDAEHRGAGHGRAIMDAGAAWCRHAGASELALNVFGHNRVARALYDSLGYVVLEELLQKSL